MTFVGKRYETDESKTRALDAVLSNLRALPGVKSAGASTSMPPTRMQESQSFAIVGKPPFEPGRVPSAIYVPATQGYIEALHIPLLRGRTFDARDIATSPPVVMISAELARQYFADVDPVGHSIAVSGKERRIVGVVGNATYEGVGAPVSQTIYVPFAQSPFSAVWIAIRSGLSSDALAPQVRNAIRAVDADLPARRPSPLESLVAESVVRPRFHAWLLATFSGVALLLASIGIYGVIAYGVAQRRSEIGIRLALGATTSAVTTMELRSGLLPVAIGIAVGLVVSALATRLLAGLLYGVAPTDAITYCTVASVLALTGLVAAYVPARRAARVDPLAAIRAE